VHPDFLLKTGLKSDFGPVEPNLSATKSNWAYAVSSDILATQPPKLVSTEAEAKLVCTCGHHTCAFNGHWA
jgi:hypothetical protein